MTPTDAPTTAALIVNTASRRGAEAYETAHRLLLEGGVPVTEGFPITDPARLRETVEQAVGAGHGLVVVGGGDGTVSSVVDALAGKFKAGYARKMYLRTGGGGPSGKQGEGQDSMHWWVR